MMIDTHCHLGKEDYDNIEGVIKNMENNIMRIDMKKQRQILKMHMKL